MSVTEAISSSLDALHQTYVQILVGGTLALLLRGSALLLLFVASMISRRATQVRLKRLNEELTLYQLFQTRPAALVAKSVELQLWTGLFAFAFVDVWAFSSTSTTQPPVGLVIAVVQVVLCGTAAWFLADLFRLVRPQSKFEKYESSVRNRITRMREGLSKRRQQLRDQQEELAHMDNLWDQADSLARQQPDGPGALAGAQADAPARQAAAATQAPQEAPAETRPFSPSEAERHTSSGSTRREEGASVAPPVSAEAASATPSQLRPERTPSASVYQSSWISGHIKRWPEWGSYGFITSDAGEDFYVDIESLAGLEPLVEGHVVLFQVAPGSPNRRAALVCSLGSYGQGRVNGIRGNVGFITIFDSQRSASIYFRLPMGSLPDFDVGDTVGFRFGRNIIGPTAERIDTDLGRRPRRNEQV
ncbi:MAG: hypothetical protein DCF16_14755 [Alphaproteobacteria bacterium]|nr:MAG: hypothetical protein DCF16_14755 [Alphaproteobacteria bacterium]